MSDDVKFWIRIFFYLMILGALLWVGYRAGGDPCERCRLNVEMYSNETITCRDLINFTITPFLNKGKIAESPKLNVSQLEGYFIK